MGTQVLRSQDCLQHRFCHESLTLTTLSVRSPKNSNPHPNNACQSRRRKRSPVAVQANQPDRDRSRHCDRSMVEKAPTMNLVMGQVKILKRGEKLSSESSRLAIVTSGENHNARAKSEGDLDLVFGSTDRLGPNPETVQKQIRVWDSKNGIYAGSAFVASPPPSSVPVPGFLGKKVRPVVI